MSISELLAIVSMGCIIKIKSIAFVSKRLSEKFGKLWLAAEMILLGTFRSHARHPYYGASRRTGNRLHV